MAAVRGKGNKTTEQRLRTALARARVSGWQVTPKKIRGRPDFLFPRERVAVFVDGCFWHGCPTCGHTPNTNAVFWAAKIARNRERDAATTAALVAGGTHVLRFWEHELGGDIGRCVEAIKTALRSRVPSSAEEVHGYFVATAGTVSPLLRDQLVRIGPVWFPDRPDRGLAVQLARSIVGQQLSTSAARSIWTRLERAAAGEPLATFLREEKSMALQACGISRNKLKALLRIGEAAAAGKLDPAAVRAMDHATRSAYLSQIWGIGQWTCDMVSIFYCADMDVWPAGDVSVQNTLARFIGRRHPHNVAKLFSPYRSILALYMWRILDGKP